MYLERYLFFYKDLNDLKNCSMQNNCKVSDRSNELSNELTKKILTQAAVYEQDNQAKKKNLVREILCEVF